MEWVRFELCCHNCDCRIVETDVYVNKNGDVHFEMRCPTCKKTTQYVTDVIRMIASCASEQNQVLFLNLPTETVQ